MSTEASVQDAGGGHRADVLWLAKRDIRRGWSGYIASALYLLLFGALVAPRDDMPLGTWSTEMIFLMMMILLAQPFFSREYFGWGGDLVAERLTFLRLFPIPLDVIVQSRMLALMAALVLNVPALFIIMWFIGDWSISGLEFTWFALFWIGVSIGLSGYSLIMEMGASIKRYVTTNVVILIVGVTALTILGLFLDLWMVRGSVRLVERFGPLMALVGLSIGIVTYMAAGPVATRRLGDRELVP